MWDIFVSFFVKNFDLDLRSKSRSKFLPKKMIKKSHFPFSSRSFFLGGFWAVFWPKNGFSGTAQNPPRKIGRLVGAKRFKIGQILKENFDQVRNGLQNLSENKIFPNVSNYDKFDVCQNKSAKKSKKIKYGSKNRYFLA